MNQSVKDRELLSSLLQIPPNMVFRRKSEISVMCLRELENAVDLPNGFAFSKSYRCPQPGDYFLDLEILARDHRLLVYRAKNEGFIPKLIINCKDLGSSKNVKFCIDVCITKDKSYALFKSNKVKLLNPYVDSTSRVAILTDEDRILIVHIEELRNLNANLPHKNRLIKWFNITEEEKKNISDLEEEIF